MAGHGEPFESVEEKRASPRPLQDAAAAVTNSVGRRTGRRRFGGPPPPPRRSREQREEQLALLRLRREGTYEGEVLVANKIVDDL